MRVVQLRTLDHTLDLHPFVSVVVDLDRETREQLVRALRVLPSGADPGLDGLVEVHGVVVDLTADNLALLDLHSDVDPVVRPDELPVEPAVHDGREAGLERPDDVAAALAEARRAQADAERTAAAAVAMLDEARDHHRRAAEARSTAAATVEAARAGRDPLARAALEAARERLVEAEADAGGHGVEPRQYAALRLAELEARRQGLEAALVAAAAVDPAPVAAALEDVRKSSPHHRDRLRETLEAVGLALGDESLTDDELIRLAKVWLAEANETGERRGLAERELSALDRELTTVRARVAREWSPVPVDMARHRLRTLEDARVAVTEAETRVSHGRDAEAETAVRRQEMEATGEAEREASRAVAAAEVVAADAVAAAHAASIVVADLERRRLRRVEDVERYLLARAAAQRSVSYAGSVPIVLDDALAGQPPAVVRRLLDRLERMAASVQVVILSDDTDIREWAHEIGPERAAVVSGRGEGGPT